MEEEKCSKEGMGVKDAWGKKSRGAKNGREGVMDVENAWTKKKREGNVLEVEGRCGRENIGG